MKRLPKEVFNIKAKGKCLRGRQRSRREQQIRKDITEGRKTIGRN
jgi:hypothetical protein